MVNNDAEQLVKWEPIEGINGGYYIDSICENESGLRIILSEALVETKKLEIIFEDGVDSYRSTDESFRLHALYALNKKYIDTHGGWTFFKVENSSYVEWLSTQSYGVSDSFHRIHFYINAHDIILDIIATYEPQITVKEK